MFVTAGMFMFTVVVACAAFSVGNFTAGIVVDKYGPTVASVIHSVLVPIAMLCFGLASADQYGIFMIGGVCMGLGGSFVLLNSFPLAFLSTGNNSALIMAAANCLFDASASIFLPLYILYHDAKVGRAHIFVGFAVISVMLSVMIVPLWFMVEGRSSDDVKSEDLLPDSNSPAEQSMPSPIVKLVASSIELAAVVTTCEAGPNAGGEGFPVSWEGSPSASPVPTTTAPLVGEDLAVNAHWATHLFGAKFWFITGMYTLQSIRAVMYMVVVLSILKSLGDERYDFLFTQMYAAGLSSSFLFIGLIHRTYDYIGMQKCFHVVNALGFVWGIIAVIPVLELQVVGFVAFYIYRAYLYSLVGMYFAEVFGPGLSGRLYGAANLFCGAVLLIQYPAYYVTVAYANSNYTYLNIFTLVINIVCTVFAEVAYPLAEILPAETRW